MNPKFSVGDQLGERFSLREAISTPDHQCERWAALDKKSGALVMLTVIGQNDALEREFRGISARLKMLSHPHINPHLDFWADAENLIIVDALPQESMPAPTIGEDRSHKQLEPKVLLEVLEFSEALGFSIADFSTDWVWIDKNGEPILLLLGWPNTATLRDAASTNPTLEGPTGFGSWLYQHQTGDIPADANSIEGHPTLTPESKRLIGLAQLNKDASFSSLARAFNLEETLTEAGSGVSALDAKPFDKITPKFTHEVPNQGHSIETESTPDGSLIRLLGIGLLVIVAGFVFLVLPGLVSQPQVEPLRELAAGPKTPEGNVESPSPLTVAKDKLAREEALRLAEVLLRKIINLEDLGMRLWDADQLLQINEAAVAADEAYRAGNHQAAVLTYQMLIEQAENVESRLPSLQERYRILAESALSEVNETEAQKNWEILAALSSEDTDIQQRWQQVQSLPQISAMMAEAELLEQAGEPNAAINLLTQASQLFPDWPPPKTRRIAIERDLNNQAFRESMSAGFARLNEADFDEARLAFETAGRLQPNQNGPGEGLELVRQAQLKLKTSSLSSDAAAAEADGQWSLALGIYTEILSLNPALTTLEGRIAVIEERIEIAQQLDALIKDPSQLQSDERLKEARSLVISVSQLAPPVGDLKSKLTPLSRYIMSARRPLTLNLSSDGLTTVTVLNVGAAGSLGMFAETSLRLIPGRYVVTGTRKGYVDVRYNIELKAETTDVALRVACEERIP